MTRRNFVDLNLFELEYFLYLFLNIADVNTTSPIIIEKPVVERGKEKTTPK